MKKIAVLCLGLCWAGAAAWAAPKANDGDGTLTVSPVATTAGSTGNSFIFSFRNGTRGDFNAGSQISLDVPLGWTAPQSTVPGSPGYVSVVSTAGTATASILSVTGAGPWVVTVNFTASKGTANGFTLGYAGGGLQVVAPVTTGTYAFVARTKQNGGTLKSLSASPSIAVTKGIQTISFSPVGDRLTTDAVGLSATASSGLPVSFSVAAGPALIHGGTNLTFSGEGAVSIVASQAGDANWNTAPAVTQTFAVAKAMASVVLNNLNQIYDGTARMVTATTVPGGLNVAIRYDGNASAPKSAGNYAVVATINDDMYQGSATGTLVVAKAVAAVELEGLSQTYDGTPKSVSATTVPPGMSVVLTYDGLAIAPMAAGSYAVVATVVDANYDGGASGTLVVAKAPAAITLDNLSRIYDGTPRVVTASTEPAGLTVEITYDGSSTPPVHAGSYAVEAAVIDPDYEGSASGTLGVAKAQAVVVLEDLVRVFDGTPKSVAVDTDPNGLPVDVVYEADDPSEKGRLSRGSSQPPVEAGIYEVNASVSSSNYEGGATGTLEIVQAPQTIDFAEIGDQLTTDKVELSATASSGLPVAFAVLEGPAVIADETNLTFAGTGSVSVVALQPGDDNWEPANDVVCTFDVHSPAVDVEVHTTALRIREGGEGRLYVRLAEVPASAVEVSIGHGGGDENLRVESGGSLTFTPTDWNVWQGVVLAANEDDNADGETATFRVSVPGGTDRWVEATSLDDDIGENLALASSGSTIIGGSRGGQAVDGVHTSKTNYAYMNSTSVPPGALTLDLKIPATLSRIRVLNWDWTLREHRYMIESSLDGVEWSLLVDARTTPRNGWDDWAVPATTSRYLRLTGLSNSANAIVCIPEWEVYGSRARAILSSDHVRVRENGEGRFFVKLDQAPTANLVLSVGRSGGDEDLTILEGSALTFTPANWNVWQKVTLAAADDAGLDDGVATVRITIPGLVLGTVSVSELDDDIGDNLALGGKITGGSRGSQAIDGLHATISNYAYMNSTSVPPGALTLDLQTLRSVSRVRVLNWNWSQRAHRYKIESSLDGATWSLLVDASATDCQGWDDWNALDTSARYLRLTGLSNSANALVCISEWEVYGPPAPPVVPVLVFSKTNVLVREAGEGRFFVRLDRMPSSLATVRILPEGGDPDLSVASGSLLTFTPANWNSWQGVTLAAAVDADADAGTATFRVDISGGVAQSVVATEMDVDVGENLALASGGTTALGLWADLVSNVIDGVHGARANYGVVYWANYTRGKITLDLKEEMALSRVRLLNWDWTYRVHRYQIETSLDGATWTLLADTGESGRQGWDEWMAEGVSARYLRFVGLSNSVNNAICISELEVYGSRPVGRRSLVAAAGKRIATAEEAWIQIDSVPVAVLTSEGPEDGSGWAAVDGDPETAWVGQKAGGGYLVVEYQPALELSALEVDLAEGSLADIECRYSANGQEWLPLPEDLEENPVSLNFLWLVFPDDGTGAVPQVLEIGPNP